VDDTPARPPDRGTFGPVPEGISAPADWRYGRYCSAILVTWSFRTVIQNGGL
jgi:hypothetical protein